MYNSGDMAYNPKKENQQMDHSKKLQNESDAVKVQNKEHDPGNEHPKSKILEQGIAKGKILAQNT
jgi:hypothetical protein